jgi:hypothetical protein
VSDLAKSYTDKIFKGLHYLPTWLPSAKVAVGDVAKIEERAVTRQLSLEDLSVEFSTHENATVAHRGWASKGALTLGGRAKATTPAQNIGANTHVEFNAKHAILFRAERSKELNLERQALVEKELLRLHEDKQWEADWVLITHVIRAHNFTALISQEKGARAELRLTGTLGSNAAGLDREDVGVEVLHTEGMAYAEHGVVDATPLYRAIRVQKRITGHTRTKRARPTGRLRAATDEFEVAEVQF